MMRKWMGRIGVAWGVLGVLGFAAWVFFPHPFPLSAVEIAISAVFVGVFFVLPGVLCYIFVVSRSKSKS